MSQSSQLPEVLTRGVAQVLPSAETLHQLMAQRPIKLYLGIDPTGSLLTLGHSIALRKLQQFAAAGHQVILLIGSGTVKIGDPTGRDQTRPTLSDAEIQNNFKDWQAQASKILDFDKIEVRYNGDWLDKLSFTEMVQLMAKTTLQQLMERDMFQDRLAKGLPIHTHELVYPLLQGYDSVVMEVDLEIGGTDQTFNMMMGRTLLKSYRNKDKWVLTVPIINGLDGRKMSKTYGNFVALTDPAPEMYGKLMSISDDQIIEYFTLLTDTPVSEIDQMSAAMLQGANPMEFKKRLAHTITVMYHDIAAADAAAAQFQTTVQDKGIPSELPTVKLPPQPLTALELAQLCLPQDSKSALRRLITQSAMELLPSGQRPTEPQQTLELDGVEVVRLGKRQYFKLQSSPTAS